MNAQEFLNLNRVDNIYKEIALSNRISDTEGKPLLFRIKALTTEEFEGAKNRANISGKGDMNVFKYAVIIRGCVSPSFKDAGSLEEVGARTPEDYVRRVLLAGEISHLAAEILRLSGFGEDV